MNNACIHDCNENNQLGRTDFKAYLMATAKTEKWHTTKQGSRASCLDLTIFAVLGKVVQFVSGSPFVETDQIPQQNSVSAFAELCLG